MAEFQQESRTLTEQLVAKDRVAKEEQERDERQLASLGGVVAAAQSEYRSALSASNDYDEWLKKLRGIAQPVLGVFLGVLAAGFLMVALLRQVPRARPFYLASGICATLLAIVTVVALEVVPGSTLLAALSPDEMTNEDQQQLAVNAETLRKAAEEFKSGTRIRPQAAMMMAPRLPDTNAAATVPEVEMARAPVAEAPAAGKLKQGFRTKVSDQQLALLDGGAGDSARVQAPKVMAMTSPPAGPVKLVAREYAYRRGTRNYGGTLCWHPALVVSDGRRDDPAFDLADPKGPLVIRAFGHTLDGRLGAATIEWTAR
jgi:hypothetical protein